MSKRSLLLSSLSAAALLGLMANSFMFGAEQEGSSGGNSIKDMMSPDQFSAAGLEKLSSEELQSLDNWLNRDRQKIEQKAEQVAEAKAAKSSKTKMDLIVSRVDGEFTGLSGGTVIKLEDGTSWKQANADDHFRANNTDHPGCAVIHTWLGYKMRIAGTPEFYVNPVRSK